MKQKSENQKAFPRFLGILVVAGLIGGVLGGLSGVAGYFWEDHTAFGAAFAHLLGMASPWAMAACAAVLLGLGLYQYRKSNTAFHGWDGEDEDVMQRAEERGLPDEEGKSPLLLFQCRHREAATELRW